MTVEDNHSVGTPEIVIPQYEEVRNSKQVFLTDDGNQEPKSYRPHSLSDVTMRRHESQTDLAGKYLSADNTPLRHVASTGQLRFQDNPRVRDYPQMDLNSGMLDGVPLRHVVSAGQLRRPGTPKLYDYPSLESTVESDEGVVMRHATPSGYIRRPVTPRQRSSPVMESYNGYPRNPRNIRSYHSVEDLASHPEHEDEVFEEEGYYLPREEESPRPRPLKTRHASLSRSHHRQPYLHSMSVQDKPSYKLASDGDKMVLQLVLPQGSVDQQTSQRYAREYPPLGRKPGLGSQQDLLSSGPRSLPGQYAYTNHAFYDSVPDLRTPSPKDREKFTPSSLGTVSDEETISPPPSSEAEKATMFRCYLTTILSCIYAVFIVTLGLVIYISDVVLGNSPLAESFSIYLVALSFLYFIFLYIDIRRYLKKVKDADELNQMQDDEMLKDDMEFKESIEGDLHLSIALPRKALQRQRSTGPDTTPHQYCFSQGRHSGSFYLKIGAAVFCLGHLIHSGLLLGYQIVFLTSETDDFYNCASVPTLVLDVLYPVFSFFQLFFIFKYSNVIINRCKEIGKFAFMHCIASSLCFWMWTIIRETMDILYIYANKNKDEQSEDGEDQDSSRTAIALPLTSQQRRGADELVRFFNTPPSLPDNCRIASQNSVIYENYSPYLYPFTIEYSILIVGILYIIWQNIGHCSGENGGHCALPVSPESSNLVMHADCHSANKGLFAGIIILVGSVVSIILFFIAMANSSYVDIGLLVNTWTELVLLIIMTFSVIFAYRQLTRLDINKHPISLLDDLLLFICIPAFFLHAIFSVVPAVQKSNFLSLTTIIFQVVQVLLQTPFIIDGLRRCSNTKAMRHKKPGRELVTFLVICNVALWITETFEIKSHDKIDDRYEVYGKVLWTIISHLTLPLTMFYRFHSSVCLADIWKSAYEKGE